MLITAVLICVHTILQTLEFRQVISVLALVNIIVNYFSLSLALQNGSFQAIAGVYDFNTQIQPII